MINNDVLRSLAYSLNLGDKKIIEIIHLAGLKIELNQIQSFMKNDEDPNYIICDDHIMAHFLDGLIYFKRGKDDSRPVIPFELPISNNLVLKKMKVAFQLKEEDMHLVLEKANYPIGRAEMSAFLRKRGHENYRECGDQVLRYFLKGLKLRLRGSDDEII